MLVRFARDGDRYIVFGRPNAAPKNDEERIGFVRKDGKRWNAADSYMDKSRYFPTRDRAAAWLQRIASHDER